MPDFEMLPFPEDEQPRIEPDGDTSNGSRLRKEPEALPPEIDKLDTGFLSDHYSLGDLHRPFISEKEPFYFPPIVPFPKVDYLKSHFVEKLKNESKLSWDGAYIPLPPEEEEKPEKKGPTLDDIGGYEDAKEQIRKFLAAAQHPEKFRQWGAKPPKGLLLYGPPGTGKTMFAKAIATELDGHFQTISPADINSKWFGESEQRIKDMFEEARERDGHTVIFMDEIESMLPQRSAHFSGGVMDSIMTMFLQYMDGKDSPDNVTIIGATNRLDALDSAVLRPGRFDRKIEIGYPDPEARAAILDIHIACKEKAAGRTLFNIDKEALSMLLKGVDILTGAQIAEVVRRVCEAKAYEALETGENKLATVDDLVAGFASLISESARFDS